MGFEWIVGGFSGYQNVTGAFKGVSEDSRRLKESRSVSRHPHEFKGASGISGASPVVSGAFEGVLGAFR